MVPVKFKLNVPLSHCPIFFRFSADLLRKEGEPQCLMFTLLCNLNVFYAMQMQR